MRKSANITYTKFSTVKTLNKPIVFKFNLLLVYKSKNNKATVTMLSGFIFVMCENVLKIVKKHFEVHY